MRGLTQKEAKAFVKEEVQKIRDSGRDLVVSDLNNIIGDLRDRGFYTLIDGTFMVIDRITLTTGEHSNV